MMDFFNRQGITSAWTLTAHPFLGFSSSTAHDRGIRCSKKGRFFQAFPCGPRTVASPSLPLPWEFVAVHSRKLTN